MNRTVISALWLRNQNVVLNVFAMARNTMLKVFLLVTRRLLSERKSGLKLKRRRRPARWPRLLLDLRGYKSSVSF
jgi:hypothetical protein